MYMHLSPANIFSFITRSCVKEGDAFPVYQQDHFKTTSQGLCLRGGDAAPEIFYNYYPTPLSNSHTI